MPVTIHIPLRDVAGHAHRGADRRDRHDRRRAISGAASPSPQPRLAVAGLNPHAGEGGAIGTEDRSDHRVRPSRRCAPPASTSTGPLSADAMFHPAARAGYDAAICMYHDQALIPAKTLVLRRDGQCHARPRLRPHLAGSRHGARHRRHRQGRSVEPRRGASPRGRTDAQRERCMSAIDDLPPLRDVIARHELSRHQRPRPEFPSRPQPHGADRPRRRRPRRRHRHRGRPGPGRADAGAARRRGAAGSSPSNATSAALPRLREIAARYPGRLTVIEATRSPSIWPRFADGPTRIVANLPYNIATPLLVGWLQRRTLAAAGTSR